MQEYLLGELLEKIIGGGTPSKRNSDYWGGEIPWASVKDMPDDRYRLKDTTDHISKVGLKNSSSNLIPAGTVITSTRMGLGRCFINEVDMAINQDLKALFPKESLDNKFLLWWLASKATELESIGSGTTVKGIRLDQLRALRVLLPSLEDQQKIASILSAFDDLIENNNRRIAILEEMAQLIYREWFVHYKYPGHKNDQLVDSGTDLGDVPEGWEILEAQELIDFNPRTSIDKDKERPYLPMGGVSENSMVIDDSEIELRTGSSGTKFQNLDTLFARITPSLENGKTGFVQFLKEDQLALGSTEFVVMRSKKLNPYYVYCLARDDQFRETAIKSMAGASGRQRVRVNSIKEYKLPLPPEKVLDDFGRSVKSMFQHIHILTEHNKKLKATRDLLLPRLISGKMEV